MLRFVLKERDGKERVVVFEKDVVRIGKSTTNDLILPEAGVSRRHAIVRRAGDKVVIEDLVSTNGTFVNGKRISGPQEIDLRDKIFIAGYVLQLDMIPLDEEEPTRPTQMEKMKEPGSQPPAVGEKTDLEFQVEEAPEELHDDKFKTIALTEQEVEEWAKPEQTEEALKSWEEPALEETSDKAPTRDLEEVLEGEKYLPPVELFDDEKEDEQIPLISLSEEDILDVYGQEPSQREEIAPEGPEIPPQGAWVEEEKEMPSPVKEELAAGWPSEEEQPMEQPEEILPAESPVADHDIEPSEKAAPFEADIGGAASLIYRRLIDQPELYWRFLQPGQDISERQNAFLNTLQSLLAEKDLDIPSDIPREELIQRVMQETVMPGIVEQLMDDPENRCILINGKDHVFIERAGKMERTEYCFSCDEAVMAVASWMLERIGKHVDPAEPIVNARLGNGSVIHIIIPPLAHSGPCVTILKPVSMPITMADLIEKETLSNEMAQLLTTSVENGMNILITGTKGAGKTTLLNALASVIPEKERIVTIEEWPELKLHQENVVSLLSIPAQSSERGAFTMMDLVRNSMQMRPDRLVMGGCSGEEVMEILQSSTCGIRGVLAAVHANSPRQVLTQLTLSAGPVKNPSAILPWIASMVDLVVQCVCMTDGRRKVMSICEVADSHDEPFALRDIFRFESREFDKETGSSGRFVPQNVVPRFIEEIETRGALVNREIFQKL